MDSIWVDCRIVAKLIMPGPDPGGRIVTILLGIVGALIGIGRERARADIFDYIERWHNPRERRRLAFQQQGQNS
jgi:hypothetical protein